MNCKIHILLWLYVVYAQNKHYIRIWFALVILWYVDDGGGGDWVYAPNTSAFNLVWVSLKVKMNVCVGLSEIQHVSWSMAKSRSTSIDTFKCIIINWRKKGNDEIQTSQDDWILYTFHCEMIDSNKNAYN